MEIVFKKHLFKMSNNGKACGCIDFLANPENKPAHISGSIAGEYDYISSIDEERVKQAFELIFKED